ncbi:MAG: TldD/PmbA family protein [bacterium]|jgi:PmbA protein|nr:TldD/PmbA family protein [candidate division KSB1 bacterium]MDH7561670.1 TldD/PmbA family protein [bacterium]
MNKSEDLLALAESLVEFGRRAGAEQIEVGIHRGVEFTARVRNGQIEHLVEAGARSIGARVIVDHRVATTSSSDLRPDTLQRLLTNAVSRARLVSADPYAGLPEKEELAVDIASLRLYDPAIASLGAEEKIQMALDTEELCLADPRIKSSYGATCATSVGQFFLANSLGFSGWYEGTSISLGVYLQAGRGDELVEDGWYEGARHLADLPPPEAIAEKALHRVTRMIGPRKIATQNVPVVLEPDLTGELLYMLFTCVNGEAIYQRQSFLVDKLGEKVASDKVNVVDDGLFSAGPGTRPFDGEGVPTRKTVVIEQGVLRSYLLDTYSARKLGMQSTGNASGVNNFHMAPGPHAPGEIIASVDKGLLVTGTMGWGFNPVTGDLSRGAFGLWIERGQIVHPVAEVTISGNLASMLRNVEMVGNDFRLRRSIIGPTIKIAEMTVAGA